jgi:hypothetical protein
MSLQCKDSLKKIEYCELTQNIKGIGAIVEDHTRVLVSSQNNSYKFLFIYCC